MMNEPNQRNKGMMKMSEEVMEVIKTIRKSKEDGDLKNLLKIHQELIFELNNRLTKIEQQQEQDEE